MKSIWDRYVRITERIIGLTKSLEELREELETVDLVNADEAFARSEVLLKEYSDAIDEFTICDYSGKYTNEIDFYVMKAERELVIKMMRCFADTNKWSREDVARMAKDFLTRRGAE